MKTVLRYPALFACILCVALGCGAAADPVEVRINPSVSHGTWQGWGVSLAWWAKAFGDRDVLADLLFTSKTVSLLGQDLPGLELNIVRFNAGACSWNEIDGRQMKTAKAFRPFRQMEGFWLDGKETDPASSSWDWTVDANQRAMLAKARDRGANYFELFSNSPMWWMCRNENPSGNASGRTDNLAPGETEAFAIYLATVAKYAREHWGITFTSVEPFNEPDTDFWKADGKQEGCHFSHELEAQVLPMLRAKLDERGLTGMPIAAADDNTYDESISTWQSFNAGTKSVVNKINTHGYQFEAGRRDELSRMAVQDGKQLWNSEYGEIDGTGLRLAKNLDLDFRYLHPTAWCYWQPFDSKGWGFIRADLPGKQLLEVNPKYFVVAQYTRHLRPGMTLLQTDDADTVAAYDARAHKLVLILRADTAADKSIDLGGFARADGPVTRWITEPKGTTRYQKSEDLHVADRRLEVSVPANSIQSIEIENVSLR